MLLNDAPTRANLLRTRPAGSSTGRQIDPVPPMGTPTYHCFRYLRVEHGLPTDADGTVLLGLPVTARAWLKNPWRQYETDIWLEADIATAWLGDQLRAAADFLAADPNAPARLGQQWRTCSAALDSLESACHTSIAFPGGNLLALAIVAVWDPKETHPLLRGTHAGPEGSAP